MKYLFKQFVLFISTITNIGFCNENLVTISVPLYDNTATFNETQAVVDKYLTLNYFVNNNINVTNNKTTDKYDFNHYCKMYDELELDIFNFRTDIKNGNYNMDQQNNIKNIFFNILHSMRHSLQKLALSSTDIKEQNRINTYVNINLKPSNIYLVLS